MNSGLGTTLWISSAPSMIAQSGDPGMPSAIMVVSAPPAVALFAASGAMMPSISPVPKRSGCFDAFFAWS